MCVWCMGAGGVAAGCMWWVRAGMCLAGMESHRAMCGAMVELGDRVHCWVPLHGVSRWVGNKGSGSR